MKKLFTLILAMAFSSMIAIAQSLSPSVISSAGDFFTSTNASLSFTVAEMTMVETFASTNNFLTQGFQQPEDYYVHVPEHLVSEGNVLIYPNPTNGKFTLNFFTNSNAESTIKFYNLLGQEVYACPVSQKKGQNTLSFDFSNFSQGMYMMQLNLIDAKGEKITTYSKFNIVY